MNQEKLRPIDTRIENLHAQFPSFKNGTELSILIKKEGSQSVEEEVQSSGSIRFSPASIPIPLFLIILLLVG